MSMREASFYTGHVAIKFYFSSFKMKKKIFPGIFINRIMGELPGKQTINFTEHNFVFLGLD